MCVLGAQAAKAAQAAAKPAKAAEEGGGLEEENEDVSPHCRRAAQQPAASLQGPRERWSMTAAERATRWWWTVAAHAPLSCAAGPSAVPREPHQGAGGQEGQGHQPVPAQVPGAGSAGTVPEGAARRPLGAARHCGYPQRPHRGSTGARAQQRCKRGAGDVAKNTKNGTEPAGTTGGQLRQTLALRRPSFLPILRARGAARASGAWRLSHASAAFSSTLVGSLLLALCPSRPLTPGSCA